MTTALSGLERAQQAERSGDVAESLRLFDEVIEQAEGHDSRLLADALRQKSIVLHRRNEVAQAVALCQRSHDVAVEAGAKTHAARALNTRAGFAFESGDIDHARQLYHDALALAPDDPAVIARIEQNLGILDNTQGDMPSAMTHYQRSLDEYTRAGDSHGRAIAFHNLGMMSADSARWSAAHEYFSASAGLAKEVGDRHLLGLCCLNHAEVHLAFGHSDQAHASAERALSIFEQLESHIDKADAYRVLGTISRETGQLQAAEIRLKQAVTSAQRTGSILSEAEARRELAILFEKLNRNIEALTALNTSFRLFGRLNAREDLVDVNAKVAALEGTYLKLVARWGESIESSDAYTHGHCERVARYSVAVAESLGLDEATITTVRLGAYLHDLGKVRVPIEVLNKPGRLTQEEFDVMKMHPIWGVELLEDVEFPWDIKPIIRWHHEKFDGTGYPDRLAGDAIPLSAQVIGIADVYDALTTTRSYRPAMAQAAARAEMIKMRNSWRPEVFDAFEKLRAATLDPAPAAAPALSPAA